MAKVSCILRHQGVQLIFAYRWARLAILVAGKDREGTRVLQKVLSLGSDSVLRFIKYIFITNLHSIPPLLKHIFVTFLPSCEKQINSLLLVSVGDTDK